jgi:hypothetical protein
MFIAIQATMFDRTALPTWPKPWTRVAFDPNCFGDDDRPDGCDQFKTDHSPPGDNDWLANLCWIYRDAKAMRMHQIERARRAQSWWKEDEDNERHQARKTRKHKDAR